MQTSGLLFGSPSRKTQTHTHCVTSLSPSPPKLESQLIVLVLNVAVILRQLDIPIPLGIGYTSCLSAKGLPLSYLALGTNNRGPFLSLRHCLDYL